MPARTAPPTPVSSMRSSLSSTSPRRASPPSSTTPGAPFRGAGHAVLFVIRTLRHLWTWSGVNPIHTSQPNEKPTHHAVSQSLCNCNADFSPDPTSKLETPARFRSEALLRLYLRYGLGFHACCAETGWQRFLTPPGASAFAHQNLARQIAHHYWSAQQVRSHSGCDHACPVHTAIILRQMRQRAEDEARAGSKASMLPSITSRL